MFSSSFTVNCCPKCHWCCSYHVLFFCLSETIKAAQTSAKSAPEAAAERAAAGSQRAPEWTVSERGGAVPESDGGGWPLWGLGHTDVTVVNRSVLPLRLPSYWSTGNLILTGFPSRQQTDHRSVLEFGVATRELFWVSRGSTVGTIKTTAARLGNEALCLTTVKELLVIQQGSRSPLVDMAKKSLMDTAAPTLTVASLLELRSDAFTDGWSDFHFCEL